MTRQHKNKMVPVYSALALALLSTIYIPSAIATPENEGTEFDIQAIRARGVDPKVAEWFSQAPRFMAGETTVNLTVNGSNRGRVLVRFDKEGQLCADNSFIKQADLLIPSSFDEDAACLDLRSIWPQTEMDLDPGEERIVLVVPPQAVAVPGIESGNWEYGGTAGMLNYDAQYMDSAGSTSGVNFMQLGSEAGANFSNWILRSRQTFSRFNGEEQFQHQAAYAQRSFTGLKKVLQAGQINLSNSMFGAGQVLGFQLFPEQALQGKAGGPGLVEGIADTQSVVEVRQSGVLVYSTTVPAGPFRLQGLPLLNMRTDLNVTLTGSNGEKRQFVVPAATFLLNGGAVAPGLSFGAGKLDQQGSSEEPVLATVGNGWVITPYTTINAGAMGSAPYRAGALSLDSQIFDGTLWSIQSTLAQDNKHGNSGLGVSTILNHQATERIGFNLNARQQSRGYRELSDALQDDTPDTTGRTRHQFGAGISWAGETVGNLSFSVARSSTWDGDTTHYLRGGWSRQISRAYVGASLEHDTGTRNTSADNRFYLTVSLPFGNGRNVSTYFNSSRNSSRAGIRYSDRTSQDRGWSLASDRDFRNNRNSNTGSVDMVTPLSQLSASLSQYSGNYTTWSARASGAVVVHDGGATLSPYQVRDTFGIARVGEEAGVRLDTPAGPTWTDGRGYAVLPSLNGYKRSVVQVDTRSLAKNVDIGNAWRETETARGSVTHVGFDVVRTRRVLVDVKNAQGRPLPHGASVFNAAGEFVTVVGEGGKVFVPDASSTGLLDVQSSGTTLCSFNLSLPEKASTAGLYEEAQAVCR
ncbi:fimbria/pilus outer membrane usher protein [Klebsiella aerogenes]